MTLAAADRALSPVAGGADGFGPLRQLVLNGISSPLTRNKGDAKLDQIQLSPGHASIQTKKRYLGVQQDLTDAPCDYLHRKVE